MKAHFRRLNDKWLMVIEEVCELKGFEDFLRPRRLSTLLGAAAKAPVVILNASSTGCAALILTASGVRHVPLVLTFTDVTTLVNRIQLAAALGTRDPILSASIHARVDDLLLQMLPSTILQPSQHMLESREMTRVRINRQSEDDFQMVLAVLWESAIKPVIDSLCWEVSLVGNNEQFHCLQFITVFRNPRGHANCGGYLRVLSPFSQYMLQEYIPRSQNAFMISQFRHIPRRSVHFSPTYPFLTARSR
jgi:hypothetical protein